MLTCFQGAALAAGLLLGTASEAEPLDEPGLQPTAAAPTQRPASSPASGSSAASRPASPTTDPRTTRALLTTIEKTCSAAAACAHFDLLVRWSQDPKLGPEAVRLLGQLRDPRSAQVLALVAVYGASAEQRGAAQTALRQLARAPKTRAAVERIRASDPDAQLRASAANALAGQTASSSAARVAAFGGAEAAKPTGPTEPVGDPGRVVYLQTAIPATKGTLHWTAHNLLLHSVDYALTDYLELGVSALVPLGIYGVFPRLRLNHSVSDKLHVGLIAMGGVLGAFTDWSDNHIFLYGAGPVVTFGTEKLFVNLSLLVGAASVLEQHRDVLAADPGGFPSVSEPRHVFEHHWLMLPHLGCSWRFRHNMRANLEVVTPLGDHASNGQIWAILYGVRLFGRSIYGDISFVIPIYDEADELLKYAWLGLPLLSFGYQWD